jgi:hypothetical protein
MAESRVNSRCDRNAGKRNHPESRVGIGGDGSRLREKKKRQAINQSLWGEEFKCEAVVYRTKQMAKAIKHACEEDGGKG